jgi:hypothetical protein
MMLKISILVACAALTACAATSKQPIWSESNSAATHPDVAQPREISAVERAQAQCRMQSAMLPGPPQREYIPGVTPRMLAPSAAGMDLGAAMQHAATQMQFMDDCMRAQGFSR